MQKYGQIQLCLGPLRYYLEMHSQITLVLFRYLLMDYGAQTPACDADVHDEELLNSDDYAAQSLLEVGSRVLVAMTLDRLREEIQYDELYKYLRQTIAGNVRISKFVGELSVYNYHKYNLTISLDSLFMYKGSWFLVPNVLRPGLLRALRSGNTGAHSFVRNIFIIIYYTTNFKVKKWLDHFGS